MVTPSQMLRVTVGPPLRDGVEDGLGHFGNVLGTIQIAALEGRSGLAFIALAAFQASVHLIALRSCAVCVQKVRPSTAEYTARLPVADVLVLAGPVCSCRGRV